MNTIYRSKDLAHILPTIPYLTVDGRGRRFVTSRIAETAIISLTRKDR